MLVNTLDDAYRRRNRGVEGFLQLKAAFERDAGAGRKALNRFYERAAARTAGLREHWRTIVSGSALSEAQTSLSHLAALKVAQVDYLFDAQHYLINADDYSVPGFCGHLNRYFEPATLSLDGISQA
jgi:hypothetical protein